MTAGVNSALETAAVDARPPAAVVRITSLIMRPLLRTPLSRMITPLALLEFTGRHSGARRRVVVGWHSHGTTYIVVTPASWRANFEHAHPAIVYWRGRRSSFIGTLDHDPERVADAVSALLRGGTSARSLALQIPAGHTLDADDMTRTNRAIVRFAPADSVDDPV